MGAEQFESWASGKTAQEAFDNAREQAAWDYGHAGYTGTIAEKTSFRMVDVPEGRDPAEYIMEVVRKDTEYKHWLWDKWGPAAGVKLGDGKYLFVGMASS